jgi:hypothetical protein
MIRKAVNGGIMEYPALHRREAAWRFVLKFAPYPLGECLVT